MPEGIEQLITAIGPDDEDTRDRIDADHEKCMEPFNMRPLAD